MPLPSSGALTFTALKNEFWTPAGSTIRLSDFYGTNASAPAFGNPISVGTFYGKTTSNTELYYITTVSFPTRTGGQGWAFESQTVAGAKDGYVTALVGTGNDSLFSNWVTNLMQNNPSPNGKGTALTSSALISKLTISLRGYAWLYDNTGSGNPVARGNVRIYATATKTSDPGDEAGTLIGEIEFTTADQGNGPDPLRDVRPTPTYQTITNTLDISSLNIVGANVNTLKISYYASTNTFTHVSGDFNAGAGSQLLINVLEGIGTANGGTYSADAGVSFVSKGRYQTPL